MVRRIKKMETINVKTTCTDKRAVKAEIIAPGLAIHKTIISALIGGPPSWTITHTRSGTSIARDRKTKGEAIAIAKALSELGNWDQPVSRIPKGLKQKAKMIITKADQS